MKISLVGLTKPELINEENNLFFFDYEEVEKILGKDPDKDKIINGLKRFSQNCARVCYSQYDWERLLKEDFNKNLIDNIIIPSKHHSIFEHLWFNFYIDGTDMHKFAVMLDEMAGIEIRSGRHCVHSWFNAHGCEGSVRASFYLYNTKEEVAVFLDALKGVAKLGSRGIAARAK